MKAGRQVRNNTDWALVSGENVDYKCVSDKIDNGIDSYSTDVTK